VGVGWGSCVSVGVGVGLASSVGLWLGELELSVGVVTALVGVASAGREGAVGVFSTGELALFWACGMGVRVVSACVMVGAGAVEVFGALLLRHAANKKVIRINTGALLRNMIGYLPNIDLNIQLKNYNPLFYIIL
jgi:hypothetical protein